MFFVDREVRSASDLQGLTMRVPEAPVWVDTFTALGASPTAIPSGELYTALDTGVVDGFEFPLGTAVDLNMYEPVSVWTPTGHILTNILIAASPDFIGQLCEADREALFEAVETAEEETRELWKQNNEAASGVLAENLTVMEDVDLDSFRSAVAPVHESFTSENGSELYDMIQAELSS
jgi:TRAP-type C4-dicarboxylate transport system substrate-binding protein